MNRRQFIQTAAITASVASTLPGLAITRTNSDPLAGFPTIPDFNRLITNPVIIHNIEVFEYDGEFILRVTSDGGLTGIVLCNQRFPHLLSIYKHVVQPFFIGKDARDIVALVEKVFVVNSNYKLAGMPFWNVVGHIEIALFDLLGKIAGLPVNKLLGTPLRNEVDVYLSSTTRETTPQQETDFFRNACQKLALRP